jgi:hypothetical protein
VNSHQSQLLNQIKKTWPHHKDWSLGKLLQSANNIALGEIRTNPAYSRDSHLITGLKALIPEGDAA